MSRFLGRLLLASFLTAALLSTPAYADSNTCRQFFDTMRGRAVDIFESKDQDFAKKRVDLTHLFNEVIDSQWIAHYVAGAQWRTASDLERADYVAAYTAYLSDRYIGGLDDEDMEGMQTIKLVEFKPLENNSYSAHTRIIQKSDAPIDIDFRLQEEPQGTCHVRDFTIEGVSLLSSQRDQVQNLAQSGGLKNVTQRLLEIIHSKS